MHWPISVAEKQTDVEHVTEVAQAVADRMERAGATVYFVNVYQPGHHFAYSIITGHFLRPERTRVYDRFVERLPDRQHHHRI